MGKGSKFETGDRFCQTRGQKTVISTATRAKLSAKLKAYWAAKKKSGKK
jgi:hypothetical protein